MEAGRSSGSGYGDTTESAGGQRNAKPETTFQIVAPNAEVLNVHLNQQLQEAPGQQPGSPPLKKPKINSPREDIRGILNKTITNEYERILRFNGNLRKPRQERWPDLRKWNMYDTQNQPLRRTASQRDLEEMRNGNPDLIVTMNQLFPRGTRFIVVVGGPGSGKSTFVKSYGQKVLNKEIKDMQHISIVLFIDAHSLENGEQDISFVNFLFRKPVHGFAKLDENAIDWMLDEENQREMLIIIDGLSYLQNLAMDAVYKSVDYPEPAKPAVLLYNLFQGRLLPGAKILAASRSYGIQSYHENIRPQRIIKLAGFSLENTEYLFREMVGPETANRWETFSDILKSLCSTPLFLVYVAFMQKSNSELKIKDVSSIMMCLMQNFWTKNGWEKDPNIFKALKKFGLQKLMKGQIVFTISDITEYGLEKEHMRSFCSTVPEAEHGVQECSRSQILIFFNHVLIQETLACLGFLDLPLQEYASVLKNHVETPRFSTVKQIACGILLNRKMKFEKLLADVSSKDEKKKMLLETLRLQHPIGRSDMLQHLACLHEIGKLVEDTQIWPNAIDLRMQDLTRGTTHIIAPAIANCRSLTELILYRCVLDERKIGILWKRLAKSDLKINLLDLGFNPGIGPKGLKSVSSITQHCQVRHLGLQKCGLTPDHMREFRNELKGSGCLEGLYVGSNPDLGIHGLDVIADIIHTVGTIEKLDLGCCDVSASELGKLKTHDLSSVQALVLTSYLSKSETQSRMSVVTEFITKNGIEELHINSCDLDLYDLKVFERSLRDHAFRLKVLNIANNNRICSDECHEVLCRLTENLCIERMDIDGCEFSTDQKLRLGQTVKEFSSMTTRLSGSCDS